MLLARVWLLCRPVYRQAACLSSYDVRKKFIQFFENVHSHQFVPSSPVRISGDPSLMFVNAGMNQFKPKFLGTNEPDDWLCGLKRVVNSQKCIRIGGKHNDLDDVGKDTSHHTFFEMLGSWSFGDYFKNEACEMALTLLTDQYNLSVDQLYFTYFAGDENIEADLATRDIWRSLGVSEKRVIPFSAKDNFWEMGDSGPCGPCSEIHFDYSKNLRNAADLVNRGDPEVVEIWNLVFMQFNRLNDGSLVELPNHHVDTGMGFERLTAILQNKSSNYDTDLFRPIIREIEYICKDNLGYKGGDSLQDQAYRTISDHIRMLVIAIGDKVYPGNTKEELIVRQVLRRAYLLSKKHLHAPNFLLEALCPIVVSSLDKHFKYLCERETEITKIIADEVLNFSDILSKGKNIFFTTISKMKDTNFPVETALLMRNHFGYPLELLVAEVENHNLKLDIKAFEAYQENRRLSKECPGTSEKPEDKIPITTNILENFRNIGLPFTNSRGKYEYSKSESRYDFPILRTKLIAIIDSDGIGKTETNKDEPFALLFNKTSFYHTDGGQICDIGTISCDAGANFYVYDVTNYGGYIFHHGSGDKLKVGHEYDMIIDSNHRLGCMRSHTATHLLNHALREVLGKISQHGSKVSPDVLRFTFLGPTPTHIDLERVTELIQRHINNNSEVRASYLPLQDALSNDNVRHMDDFKYTDPARIVTIGTSLNNTHSMELCGGTHVFYTGDVKDLEITSSKSQGKHKTTLQCATSSNAAKCKQTAEELHTTVEGMVVKSNLILSAPKTTMQECMTLRRDVGRVNYRVNNSEISVVTKARLKETLRKHSQMLGTKIRNLKKCQYGTKSVDN